LIKNGRELIKCCRDICPELNIIVFSGEHRVGVIDLLFKELNINAYVKKARSDSSELKKAIETVYNGNSYISHNMKFPIKSANTLEFSNFDITLLKLLSDGILQKTYLKSYRNRIFIPTA
jgi:DNA-binding NarL/FixJ family response regulator